MTETVYMYHFSDTVEMSDISEMLLLSVMAAEALHGRAQVNLDAEFSLDEKAQTCEVDAGSAVGQDVARIFVGMLTREVGEGAFQVERKARDGR